MPGDSEIVKEEVGGPVASSPDLIQTYYVDPEGRFQKVEIRKEMAFMRYYIIEPSLNDREKEIVRWIKEVIEYSDDSVPIQVIKDPELKREYIIEFSKKILKKKRVPQDRWDKIIYYVVRDLVGYGRIDALMNDKFIEDISCSGLHVPIYIWHRDHGYIPTNVVFNDKDELESLVYKLAVMAKKMISVANPSVDGILPDGSRVICNLGVVSLKGPTFTIRKYTVEPMTVIDLIKEGTITPEVAAYLWILMEHKKSIIVCGEVGAGKTTLSNAILGFIRKTAKIVTIEETPEIRLDGYENWTQKVTRESIREEVRSIDLFELVKIALRERPDYIIVGEVRGREAYVLFQAIALGHGGLTTLHADNIDSAIKRLTSRPLDIPIYLVALASAFIEISKYVDESGRIKRRVSNIKEIEGMEEKNLILRDVFKYIPEEDTIKMVGDSIELRKIATESGIPYDQLIGEYQRRQSYLALLYNLEGLSWSQLSNLIETYYLDPEEAFRIVRREGGL